MFTGAEIPEIINIHLCPGRLQIKFIWQKGKFFTGFPQVQGISSQKPGVKKKKILTFILQATCLRSPKQRKLLIDVQQKVKGKS